MTDKHIIDINNGDLQNRIREILSNIQFNCLRWNFRTKYNWNKIDTEVNNLTEWQKLRLDIMHSEIVELEEILIKTGVIK